MQGRIQELSKEGRMASAEPKTGVWGEAPSNEAPETESCLAFRRPKGAKIRPIMRDFSVVINVVQWSNGHLPR